MTVRSLLVATHLPGRVPGIAARIILATLTFVAAFVPPQLGAAPAFSDWPSRSVRIIVPAAQGSADDIAARAYAEGLSRRWLRPVVVDNTPGADAAIGNAFADRRDDHTLLYGPATMITVEPLLGETLPHDPVRDLLPIAAGASSIIVVAVSDRLPVRSLKGLVAHVRTRPGELAWAAGPGLTHLVFATTLRRHQLDMRQAFYRDAAAAQLDLAENRLHVLSHPLHAVAAAASAGAVRILAITSAEREPTLPDVPTVAEAGFPEMEIEALSGLFGPRAMPPELRDRIAADMRALARDPALQTHFAVSGQRAFAGTPAQFAAAIGRQRIRIQQIMHAIDLNGAMK